MKITVLAIGKTDNKELGNLIDLYLQRLSHYIPFELKVLPDIKNRKNMSRELLLSKEAAKIQAHLQAADTVVLLDEKGKSYSSIGFSKYIEKHLTSSTRHLVFIIGGAYGFHKDVYQRAQEKISLSTMTFSHQMVRLFFLEQLYRGFTILKGEPYHHR